MNPDEFLLLGIKNSVIAISRRSGRIEWTTRLPGGMGQSFVMVACDAERVYAYASGKLHCLDLGNGNVLWSNGLTGYGFGLATICVPGFGSTSDAAAIQAQAMAQQRRNSSGD
ncbi:MAG TPA: PQQ-binding-like beta-propeller repeat protein [Candidatus Dormibacteraeota bacterium]|nr:PQQ-binding-like beta-propeller repeat protein [Candidatus Dormibacteraeota bacterium]